MLKRSAKNMKVFGVGEIAATVSQDGYFVKCIVNSHAAVFFPGSIQHRDVKREGVSYEDDYQGNAMAAVIKPNRIEVRFHSGFSDDTVRSIFSELLRLPALEWASGSSVEYRGRRLIGN